MWQMKRFRFTKLDADLKEVKIDGWWQESVFAWVDDEREKGEEAGREILRAALVSFLPAEKRAAFQPERWRGNCR
jgi:hypothetical protein